MTDSVKPAAAEKTPAKPASKPSPWLKLTLEIGPLILFFFANSRPKLFEPFARLFVSPQLLTGENAGLFAATTVLIPAVLLALLVSYFQTRRLPIMPLVTAILVVIFGALTLYLHNPSFIKMKPTILYAAFGIALFGGLIFNKPLLPVVLDNAIALTERGWRILTLRWGFFFFFLAALNELVWRLNEKYVPAHPNDYWVMFKFPGTVIIIFLFTMAQVPLMMRHEVKEVTADEAAAK